MRRTIIELRMRRPDSSQNLETEISKLKYIQSHLQRREYSILVISSRRDVTTLSTEQ